jgi:predicted lipoprotein with Yx(FWY)xxD motif
MRMKFLVVTVALGAVALAACGSAASSAASKDQAAVPVTIITSTAVKSGSTPLGTVLVSPTGHTLYALTTDANRMSSCDGLCAQVWPALRVGKGWTVAPGIDRSLFTTTTRADGTHQLVAGQWPLYTFSGDSKPGDVNGQGSGGTWFAVGTNGKLVKTMPSTSAPSTSMPASSGY